MANSLIVKIEKDVEKEYKVEHYKEKLDGSYELAETENFKCKRIYWFYRR